MSLQLNDIQAEATSDFKSMQEFGKIFIENLAKSVQSLQIPGRKITTDFSICARTAQIDKIPEIQKAMDEVLCDPITQQAQSHAENTFQAFLKKTETDTGLLKFMNGWHQTHKTTSLVSAKIIMRLAEDAAYIPPEQQLGYFKTLAHMHEVAKDDFGLGHKGHDGMYVYLAAALQAEDWVENRYQVSDCNDLSEFLYEVGVAEHKSPVNSEKQINSIMKAMMTSIASETWNGREFNYIAQHIEDKLLSFNPALRGEPTNFRNAKGYVMGHAGEVENKHGLHALAAAQVYARSRGIEFHIDRLKETMLDYNSRVGRAFSALHRELVA